MGGGKGGEMEWEKLGEGRRKKSEKKLGEGYKRYTLHTLRGFFVN